MTGEYTADAFGVGGGSGPEWGPGGGSILAGNSGSGQMSIGFPLSGSVAVTTGAAGFGSAGGNTMLGNNGMYILCSGGPEPTDDYTGMCDPAVMRVRFWDSDKSGEAGESGIYKDSSYAVYAPGGWLPINHTSRRIEGQGFGAAGGYEGYPAPGALVIRIKI